MSESGDEGARLLEIGVGPMEVDDVRAIVALDRVDEGLVPPSRRERDPDALLR
jgi:hypothetical protein